MESECPVLPKWAPRVPREKIWRLYRSDAKGIRDEELVDDVGITLILPFPKQNPTPGRVYQVSVKVISDKNASSEKFFPVNFMVAPKVDRAPVIDGDLGDWTSVPALSLRGMESGNLLADAGSRRRASEISLALTSLGPQAYRT